MEVCSPVIDDLDRPSMDSDGRCEYIDQLRDAFYSSDSLGLGTLGPEDFEILCEKLYIKDYYDALIELLYPDTNCARLTFENFHDVFVAFVQTYVLMDGNVPPASDTAQTDTHFDGQSDEIYNADHEMEKYLEYNRKSSIENEDEMDVVKSPAYDNFVDSVKPETSLKKKYGRRSLPDQDLLRGSQYGDSAVEKPNVLQDASNFCKYADKDTVEKEKDLPERDQNRSEKENSWSWTIAAQAEEFSGEGAEEDWTNPDSEWMASRTPSPTEVTEPSGDECLDDGANRLEAAWRRVVGDPERDSIDEATLGRLCTELDFPSQPEIISQMFAALDVNSDGRVTYRQFSDLLSRHVDDSPPGEQHESDVGEDCDDVLRNQNELESRQVDEIDGWENDRRRRGRKPLHSTPYGENSISHSSNCNLTLTNLDDDAVVSSPGYNSSKEASEPISPPPGRLSLDTDTSPLCPPVVSVDPGQLASMNRGRRKRRSFAVATSNPADERHSRRRTCRSIPLPHYHPVNVRKREEHPLFYLTDENGRYVSIDTLQECWEAEGLKNTLEIAEALNLSSNDHNISIEALSEVLESECDDNPIWEPALALYKQGIKYYRQLYDRGEAERTQLTNKVNFLETQLLEQEKTQECDCSRMMQEKETEYKNRIHKLTEEISQARIKLEEMEIAAVEIRRNEIELLTEKHEATVKASEALKQKNTELSKLLKEMQDRVMKAETSEKMLLDEMDAVQCELELSRELIESQRARHSKIIDLWKQNEDELRSMQDRHDELLDALQKPGRRRTAQYLRQSSSRRLFEMSVSSNGGSPPYTTANEKELLTQLSQHFPPGTSPGHSNTIRTYQPGKEDCAMTPTLSDSSDISPILLSNNFAFLSPSSTRPAARQQRGYPISQNSSKT